MIKKLYSLPVQKQRQEEKGVVEKKTTQIAIAKLFPVHANAKSKKLFPVHANANARKVISVLVLHGIIATTNLQQIWIDHSTRKGIVIKKRVLRKFW